MDIQHWALNHFSIKKGEVCIDGYNVALIDIVKKLRKQSSGPLLLKFPDLLQKQVDKLFSGFHKAMDEFEYKGKFRALFPLKTNQFATFLDNFARISSKYPYGLETGSKAELVLAMSYNNKNAPLMVNGFKDEETIKLAFLASQTKINTTIVIEGLNELELIVKYSKIYPTCMPNIGVRVKLHNTGVGLWQNSSGTGSKFGLTSNELVKAFYILQQNDLIDHFKVVHFHIGSQMADIKPFKKAIREVARIFTSLKKMGAKKLDSINIGGGLGVEYSQNPHKREINYTIEEFSNDVIFLIKEATNAVKIKEPDIYIESGRFIASSHSVLVAPTLELFTQDNKIEDLHIKKKNPALIDELQYMYANLTQKNASEYLHDALLHMESLFNLFDLGYIDLQDKANAEVLVHLLVKKSVELLKDYSHEELEELQDAIQEKYLLNFSIFQSLPDAWGIGQNFPVLPLNKLDQKTSRSASLWDITCDSDGEIGFNKNNPLFLHEVDLLKEDYFIGFFLVGAYQEILGMNHNLFTKPTEAVISLEKNSFTIESVKQSNTILDTLGLLGYSKKAIETKIMQSLEHIDEEHKNEFTIFAKRILKENNYLKTHLKTY